jgi:hypothetical protein
MHEASTYSGEVAPAVHEMRTRNRKGRFLLQEGIKIIYF